MKKFILNADDFGISDFHNQAVLEGYRTGILTSASLCTNFEAFYNAIEDIIPKCPTLGLGIHLNIMEGKALSHCPFLTDKKGYFNKNYLYLISKQKNNNFLKQIEIEFRAQIEKALKYDIKIDHLDSHVHTHAVPEIFEIVCKLAKEYNIEFIRTQIEKPYITNLKDLNYKYLINLIKIILLAYFSNINKKKIKNYNLQTNQYIIGVGYSGFMTSKTILSGLKKIKNKNTITETIIHPCKYNKSINNSHSLEFKITQDEKLKEKILKLGFTFANYKN